MIIITKSLVEEMLANAVQDEHVGTTYDLTANSLVLTSKDLPKFKISIFSAFTNFDEVKAEIRMGATNPYEIYKACSSVNTKYGNGYFMIESQVGYWLDKEAEKFLFDEQERFENETASYTIDHIDTEISQYKIEDEADEPTW